MKLLATYGLGQMQTTPSIVFSQASSKEKKIIWNDWQMSIIISNRQPL